MPVRPQSLNCHGPSPVIVVVSVNMTCPMSRVTWGLPLTYLAILLAPDLRVIQLSPSRALNWQWTTCTVFFLPFVGLTLLTASMVSTVVSQFPGIPRLLQWRWMVWGSPSSSFASASMVTTWRGVTSKPSTLPSRPSTLRPHFQFSTPPGLTIFTA